MDLANLLASEPALPPRRTLSDESAAREASANSASASAQPKQEALNNQNSAIVHDGSQSSTPTPYSLSPQSSNVPKYVAFELVFHNSPNYRARLPMRVNIFPHDTTDSIITTVKNFYGLYEGPGGPRGVSFEDADGNTLIARYENFSSNMTVYVRVSLDPEEGPLTYQPASHHSASVDDSRNAYRATDRDYMSPLQPAQALTYGQPPSRPDSRMASIRSQSPNSGRGRRSVSSSGKGQISMVRSRSSLKSRGSSTHGLVADALGEPMHAYSSDEGDRDSTTSSRKARSEQLASAEISLDNILEGGRRKRAKFESSELPLFVPPQVPLTASMSSMSPVRQSQNPGGPFSFPYPAQQSHPFSQPLASPLSLGNASTGNGFGQHVPTFSTPSAPMIDRRLRNRNAGLMSASRLVTGQGESKSGILPTPDPTVASTISDEDVALQLMRLGEASMISSATRNSASTLDDGLSGAADAASSGTEYSGSEDEAEVDDLPLARTSTATGLDVKNKQLDDVLKSSDSNYPSDRDDENRDATFVDGHARPFGSIDGKKKTEKHRISTGGVAKPRSSLSGAKVTKPGKAKTGLGGKTKAKISGNASVASSATSRNGGPGSALSFQQTLADDEEDLSSKPRCQRCRKSKKGCDRQRPCQRCKDAGLGIDDCVSEDEGNGRKGRYGRHMGVVVKKSQPSTPVASFTPVANIMSMEAITSDLNGSANSKKRKR